MYFVEAGANLKEILTLGPRLGVYIRFLEKNCINF